MNMFIQLGLVLSLCACMTQAATCEVNGTAYDCSNRNLTAIPTDVPATATSLDLSDNLLTEIKATDFAKLTALQILILDNNNISKIDAKAFAACTALTNLSLAGNSLSSLDNSTFDGTKLDSLTLAENMFEVIPEYSLTPLTNLTYLDLTSLNKNGDLKNVTNLVLGEVFKTLPLNSLLLGGVGLRNISKNLFKNVQPGKLTMLDLSNNKLESAGDSVFDAFTSLQTLSLDMNAIKSVSSTAFKGLANLIDLDLSYNKLTAVPESLCTELKKLQRINLSGFRGDSVSDDAFSTCRSTMEGIAMTFSLMKDIGMAFANLSKLLHLDMSNNANLEITNADAFINATSLTTLDLHGLATKMSGNLYRLPEAITKLKKLTTLDVSYSRFAAFSKDDTKYFDNLTSLYATNNPYDCACKHIDFVVWFQKSPTVVPADERKDFNCSTCDDCDKVPLQLGNFSISHCNTSPEENHRKVLKYGIGLCFAGLVVGILCTSCVVYILTKRKAACFKTPYVDLDRSTNA